MIADGWKAPAFSQRAARAAFTRLRDANPEQFALEDGLFIYRPSRTAETSATESSNGDGSDARSAMAYAEDGVP